MPRFDLRLPQILLDRIDVLREDGTRSGFIRALIERALRRFYPADPGSADAQAERDRESRDRGEQPPALR